MHLNTYCVTIFSSAGQITRRHNIPCSRILPSEPVDNRDSISVTR